MAVIASAALVLLAAVLLVVHFAAGGGLALVVGAMALAVVALVILQTGSSEPRPVATDDIERAPALLGRSDRVAAAADDADRVAVAPATNPSPPDPTAVEVVTAVDPAQDPVARPTLPPPMPAAAKATSDTPSSAVTARTFLGRRVSTLIVRTPLPSPPEPAPVLPPEAMEPVQPARRETRLADSWPGVAARGGRLKPVALLRRALARRRRH